MLVDDERGLDLRPGRGSTVALLGGEIRVGGREPEVLTQQIDALAVINPDQLRYNASFMVRGLLELPVRVRRRAGA